MKNYKKPEIDIFVVVAERGYGDSVGLPGFGTEQDDLVYYRKRDSVRVPLLVLDECTLIFFGDAIGLIHSDIGSRKNFFFGGNLEISFICSTFAPANARNFIRK